MKGESRKADLLRLVLERGEAFGEWGQMTMMMSRELGMRSLHNLEARTSRVRVAAWGRAFDARHHVAARSG